MAAWRIRQLGSLLFGIIRIPFVRSKFAIKRGYIDRKNNNHFSAIGAKDEFQKNVYLRARTLIQSKAYKTAIDIGCGAAYKTIKSFHDVCDFVGIEIGSTLAHLRREYPDFKWLDGDGVDYGQLSAELVVCADVIEHVLDPDDLLTKIKSIQNAKKLVISTPDRLLVRGWYDYGPPKNPTHIREWNGKEFAAYLSSHGFHITEHQLTSYQNKTQMIVADFPMTRTLPI